MLSSNVMKTTINTTITTINTYGNKRNGHVVMEYQALFSYTYRYLSKVYSFRLGTNTYKF